MKTDLFQSCGHCWVFQVCWHIECSTFTASSFRIWNSSTRILSPPQALFVVMLSKAHLTSHSRMSGSRWVITSSWLSGSWRSFLYFFVGLYLLPNLGNFSYHFFKYLFRSVSFRLSYWYSSNMLRYLLCMTVPLAVFIYFPVYSLYIIQTKFNWSVLNFTSIFYLLVFLLY